MHYACLIVGPDPERQLEPFSAHLEVPPYRLFLDPGDIELMAEHFSLPASDLEALAARMPEWEDTEGGVEGGRLFRWSTSNPQTKYDWYQKGGRLAGFLQLKAPRQSPWWRRLFGSKPVARAEQARKGEVEPAPLLSDPPAALLLEGTWHECPLTRDTKELKRWRSRFTELFAPIPDEALLTVLDLHS